MPGSFSPGTLLRGFVGRFRPQTPIPDGPETEASARLGPFRDLKVESLWPTEHLLGDEGDYYFCDFGSPLAQGATGTQPTRGTALTFGLPAVATIIGAAANIIAIQNTDTPVAVGGTGKSVYVRRAEIVTEEATVPATTTACAWGFVVDKSANRTPSANFVGPVIPQNVNGNVSFGAVSRVYFCNAASGLTTPAQGNIVSASGYFKFAAAVAKDVFELQFGGVDTVSLITQAVATVQKYIAKAPPFVIGPGQWGLLYLAMPGAATNNVTYEPFLDIVER